MDNLIDLETPIIFYKSPNSLKLDLFFQMFQRGDIPSSNQEKNNIQSERVFNVHDNYVFIRRYFSLYQVFYVFVLRLFCLKNPVTEIMALLYSVFKVRRIKINSRRYNDWETFNSFSLRLKPKVSVVIPTLNRYDYLKDVLSDLEKQDYDNFEVIVVDQSDVVDIPFYNDWKLNIQLILQDEQALWLARNRAISEAKGEYLALTEDDVRLRFDWISEHIKCLDYFDSNISAGLFHPQFIFNDLKMAEPFFKLSHQFPTGNVMLRRNVFEKVGLFDRQFEGQRMGDGEFGLRCLLNGFKIISNPMAYIIDIKAPVGGLRQMGSWDALRPKSLFAPRPVPSVLYFIRKYYGNAEAIFYILKNIPQSYIPYKYKRRNIIRLIYSSLFPLFLPVAIFSVISSWKLASIKLKRGHLIEQLN